MCEFWKLCKNASCLFVLCQIIAQISLSFFFVLLKNIERPVPSHLLLLIEFSKISPTSWLRGSYQRFKEIWSAMADPKLGVMQFLFRRKTGFAVNILRPIHPKWKPQSCSSKSCCGWAVAGPSWHRVGRQGWGKWSSWGKFHSTELDEDSVARWEEFCGCFAYSDHVF